MTTADYTRDRDALAMIHNQRCAALWGARKAKDDGDVQALRAAVSRAKGHHARLLDLLGVTRHRPNAATLAAQAHRPGLPPGGGQLDFF